MSGFSLEGLVGWPSSCIIILENQLPDGRRVWVFVIPGFWFFSMQRTPGFSETLDHLKLDYLSNWICMKFRTQLLPTKWAFLDARLICCCYAVLNRKTVVWIVDVQVFWNATAVRLLFAYHLEMGNRGGISSLLACSLLYDQHYCVSIQFLWSHTILLAALLHKEPTIFFMACCTMYPRKWRASYGKADLRSVSPGMHYIFVSCTECL